ncbi:RING finger protein nhl-1-like [Saccostrea echinata]|uniref:RING finger protein nhl-1-like n=1 Tax=Saccostrea echinata TaxID=191078 RepID=UPI002A80BC1F|nr:RING finger protein nhl-1-like [Saccostrea echinata]
MAEHATYAANRIEELLRCAICLDRYNNPKLLPCQHTFCESPCLEGLVRGLTRTLKCPECRAEHIVPYQGVSAYPNNLTIQNFLALRPTSDVSDEVVAPASANEASGNDEFFYIPNGACCAAEDLEEEEEEEEVVLPRYPRLQNRISHAPQAPRRRCPACSREVDLMRCSHCDQLICATCKSLHMEQIQREVTLVLGQLKRGVPRLTDIAGNLERKMEAVRQRVDSMKSDISEAIERYIIDLRSRQRLLNNEAETFLQAEIRSLTLQKDNIEVELAMLASFVDTNESLFRRRYLVLPDDDVMDLKRQSEHHLERLRSYNADRYQPPRERSIEFIMDGTRISNCISNFGEISTAQARFSTTDESSGDSSLENSPTVVSHAPTPNITSSYVPSTTAHTTSSYLPSTTAHTTLYPRYSTSQAASSYVPLHSMLPTFVYPRHSTSQAGKTYAAPSSTLNASAASPHSTSQSASNYSLPQSTTPQASSICQQPLLLDDDLPVIINEDNLPDQYSEPPMFDLEYSPISTPISIPDEPTFFDSSSGHVRSTTGIGVTDLSGPLGTRYSQSSRYERDSTYPTWSTLPTSASRTLTSSPYSGAVSNVSVPPTYMAASNSWGTPHYTFIRDFDSESETSSEGIRSPRRSMTLHERRRHNLSDTRLATLLGSSAPSYTGHHPLSASERRFRSLSTGASFYRLNEARALIASTRQATANRIRSIVEEANDSSPSRHRTDSRESPEERNSSPTRVRSLSSSPRSRPPVRFNIHIDDDDDSDSSTSGELLLSRPMVTFYENESTVVSSSIIQYTNKGRAIRQIGQRGNDLGEFTWPRGIATTPRENHILVADSHNNRIQVFDNTGQFVRSVGNYGTEDGEFDSVTGIAVNSFGQIVVTDRMNHRIQIFDHNWNFQLMFGEEGVEAGQLLYPWGIASDNMGFIYVCDKENHRIQVFQSNGHFVREFGSMGHRLGHFDNPHYLAISPDNRVYVSDSNNHRIQVFSMYGDFLFSFGSHGTCQGEMKLPKGIAIDSQGFVLVADSGNNRIQVFHGDGRFYCMFGSYGSENGQFRGLEGIGILGNGDVVVSDRENHRIQIF